MVLFIILWILKEKQKPPSLWAHGSMLAIFLILYGVFRIIIEFFREPDAHLGFLAGGVTMGQLLSSLMIVGGIALFLIRKKQTA
jgi:phosphatidylglycerol:prolipoprotein diacylglycerol transferase